VRCEIVKRMLALLCAVVC